ncbi:MAG: 8-oxo-dGTP diphosphatase [Ruminococcaceae bacterium]|nr:8-oxo-dGTP diphosphatase [Oscillospiraceae bacterium]
MSRAERTILTNMCMISDGRGNVLVQERTKPDWPGVTFPGGHVEPGESFVGAVIREVKEETGLDIVSPVLCGLKQFMTDDGERYVVMFYRCNRFSGTIQDSDEGRVFWIPRGDLEKYPITDDFIDMVRVFESEGLSEFYYHQEHGQWCYDLL